MAIFSMALFSVVQAEEDSGGDAIQKILDRHSNLFRTMGGPNAVFITSVWNCTGCAAVAINSMVNHLYTIDTSITCLIIILATDEKEVQTVRSIFSTSYIIADIRNYTEDADTFLFALPAFALIDADGSTLSISRDIQHHPPDYRQIKSSITNTKRRLGQIPTALFIERHTGSASENHRDEADTTSLENPIDRSVITIASPVIDHINKRLYAINTLANCIERWDISSGKILDPLRIPDSIAYLFCPDPANPFWSAIKEQRGDITHIDGLFTVGDTLYVLLTTLSEYTATYIKEADDSILQIAWYNSQIVWKNCSDGGLIPLPPRYDIRSFVADRHGRVGGACIAFTVDDHTISSDSSIFFVMVDGRHILRRLSDPCEVRVWKQKNIEESVGKATAAQDGALWYCNPNRKELFFLPVNGSIQRVVPKGALRISSGAITFADRGKPLEQSLLYSVHGMLAASDILYLFLVPAGSSSLPCIVQTYSATTGFLGEQKLDTGLIADNQSIHLAGIDKSNLMFLLRTTDTRRWKLLRVPVPKSDIVPVSQENSAR